jgi:hypothetical protein
MGKYLGIGAVILLLTSTAWGQIEHSRHFQSRTTHVAKSCGRADVSAALGLANDGDTVLMPPGACVWDARVTIGKPMTLQGSGPGITVITGTVDTGFNAALWVDADDTVFHLRDFTFTGSASDKGLMYVTANIRGWTIDNMEWIDITTSTAGSGKAFTIQRFHEGLIANSRFGGPPFGGMNLEGGGGTPSYWTQEWSPGGTEGVIFLESNRVESTTHTTTSCFDGMRYTFRRNYVVSGTVTGHGADSDNMGCGIIEVYHNRFIDSTQEQARWFHLRAGTGVLFGNRADGYARTITLSQYRTCYGVGWGGGTVTENNSRCDGIAPVDGNRARDGHSGTHTPSEGSATVLTDSSKGFTDNEFVGFHVYNETDGSLGKVTANTATTVTVGALTGGVSNAWSQNDEYRVTSGWPCKSQIGRGPGPNAYPNQISEPLYQWDNPWSRFGGSYIGSTAFVAGFVECDDPNPQDNVREGEDYFDETARPGYIPYVYPHPLAFQGLRRNFVQMGRLN